MKLQRCKKSQVYNLNNELLCEAEVTELSEDTATLQFPESCDDILRSEVLVTFFDGIQGLVTCFCRLSDYKEFYVQPNEQISTVQCEIGEETSVIQRRNDIKVPVEIETTVSFIGDKDEPQTADITIMDISAGGIFCVCKHYWYAGETFTFSLFGKHFSFEAEVLRHQDPGTYDNRFAKEDELHGYGCRLINLSAAAESFLRKYVYEQDLYQRRLLVD